MRRPALMIRCLELLVGDRWKRGAGYFLPGVWGYPPASKSPPRLGD